MNGIGTLTWTNIKSAITYIVLTALVQFATYVIGIGDIFKIDSHTSVNIVAISLLVGFVSIVKNLLTTNDGNLLGVTKVAEEKN